MLGSNVHLKMRDKKLKTSVFYNACAQLLVHLIIVIVRYFFNVVNMKKKKTIDYVNELRVSSDQENAC